MENVNYCQLCTVMLQLSFDYGVVNSRLDGIRIPRRPWNERLCSMVFFCCCCEANAGNFLAKLKYKGIPVAINKTVGRAGRTNSKNYGLKTATKPKEETRSNLENGEFNCVKMSIFESFLYNFILLTILFYLCVSVKWSLNCSVLSSVQKSLCV